MRTIGLPVRGPRMAIVLGPHLFVTSYTDNMVVRLPWPACDHVDGAVKVRRPRGITSLDGLLYVACYGQPIGRVVAIDPTHMVISHSFPAFRPRGIAQWRGKVIVTEVNRCRVRAYSPRGTVLQTWRGLREPRDVCVWGNDMYIADTGHNRIVRISLITSERTEVAFELRPNGVATNGHTLVTTQWHTGVIRNSSGMFLCAIPPAMVSHTANVFMVCDAGSHCVYAF